MFKMLPIPPRRFVTFLNYCQRKLDFFSTVKLGGREIKFLLRSTISWKRINTFHTKEPETISWICSMDSRDIFVDIGANIGIYTVPAAIRCKKVYAFEPLIENISTLHQNILLNKLKNVCIFPFGISIRTGASVFFVANSQIGAAGNSIGCPLSEDGVYREIDERRDIFVVGPDVIKDIVEGDRLHVKIDVDGNESDCLRALEPCIERVVSILVESNPRSSDVPELLGRWGFYPTHRFGVGRKNLIYVRNG